MQQAPTFVDPIVYQRAQKNERNERELRQVWHQWAYLVYQEDAIMAERAKERLVAAIENLHSSARQLVDTVQPRRPLPTRRSASADELE